MLIKVYVMHRDRDAKKLQQKDHHQSTKVKIWSMIIVDLMARFKRYRYKIIVALLVIIILFYLYSQKGKFKNTFSFTSDPNMVTNTDKVYIISW